MTDSPPPRMCSQECGRPAAPRRKMCYRCKTKQYRDANPDYGKTYGQSRRAELKLEVIALYGGKCACCGETEPIFLTLDHVEPIGNKNRDVSGGTRVLYDARRRHGDGYYQLLCFNCNFAKHWGGCPHQKAPDGG